MKLFLPLEDILKAPLVSEEMNQIAAVFLGVNGSK